MDPDALRSEIDEWVREGIITEEQAEAIASRYDTDADGGAGIRGRSRAVVALSAVGAALVFAGVVWFLATNWSDLPTAARVAVLLAAPGSAYAAGGSAYRRSLPRAGLALSILGAVLVGPSAFLLADLAAVEVDSAWLLAVWTAAALSTGHALASRVGIGLGLALAAAVVVDLTGPADPMAPLALFGVAVFCLAGRRDDVAAPAYRGVGAAIALAGLLAFTTLEGRFERFDPALSPASGAVAAAALAGTAWLGVRGTDRPEFGWAAAAVGAVGIALAAAIAAPESLPAVAAFLVIHAAALSAIAATGYLGYRRGRPRFVDLAAAAALGQTLSFVAATVVDALAGSAALVVAGAVLIAAAVALERGRRSLRSRVVP